VFSDLPRPQSKDASQKKAAGTGGPAAFLRINRRVGDNPDRGIPVAACRRPWDRSRIGTLMLGDPTIPVAARFFTLA
jgi:hypothetical protein